MRRDKGLTCDDASALIPALADGGDGPADVVGHVRVCLRCQAQVANYRRMMRDLSALNEAKASPPEGALADTLAALRAQPAPYRPVVVGGVVATAAGAAAGVAGMIVWRSRRRVLAG